MFAGYTASAPHAWLFASIIVSMFRKETRLTSKTFVEALENGAKNTIELLRHAIAGIIVGIVSLTVRKPETVFVPPRVLDIIALSLL